MQIRKARDTDLAAAAGIYEEIHDAEEAGLTTTGWLRGVYPTADTAKSALFRDDLYVLEQDGLIKGTAVINHLQPECYAGGRWSEPASPDNVLVLHTLVISPREAGKGYGSAFVAFYEEEARREGCRWLRMDTNARNAAARSLYHRLGYHEIGTVPTVFNGIEGVDLKKKKKRA